MDNTKIIDKAYLLAKSTFEDQDFSTSQLWKLVLKDENKENNDDYVNFYVELLQDPRFVALGSDKWRLRDYVTVEEFNKLANSKYSNVEYSSEDRDDEKVIDELIDEELEDDIIENNDDIDNSSDEYEEEESLDNEIEEEDSLEEDDEDDE